MARAQGSRPLVCVACKAVQRVKPTAAQCEPCVYVCLPDVFFLRVYLSEERASEVLKISCCRSVGYTILYL